MYQGTLDLFFPAPGSTIISPGTDITFYFDHWKVVSKWGPTASSGPMWTRNAMTGAGNALSSYFHHGEGEIQRQHPFKAATRYSNQRSIWSFSVVEAVASEYRHPGRRFNMHGKRYLREPLPPDDCKAVFKQASQWAASFNPSETVPDGTALTFVSNEISLRLRVDRSTAEKPVPVKYRELATLLSSYVSSITKPGQAGWTGAWVSFGMGVKRTGYWELAHGYLTTFPLGSANSTGQVAAS